jgi:hypothetical protein
MNATHWRSLIVILAGSLLLPVLGVRAQDTGEADKAKIEKAFPGKPNYSPYAGRNYPTRPLFGDTHLHTGWSFDAGTFGAKLTPSDAYRFARGEELLSNTGQRVKLSRPLDFLVVADHSDNMGLYTDLAAGKPELIANPKGRRWYDMIQSGKGGDAALEMIYAFVTVRSRRR